VPRVNNVTAGTCITDKCLQLQLVHPWCAIHPYTKYAAVLQSTPQMFIKERSDASVSAFISGRSRVPMFVVYTRAVSYVYHVFQVVCSSQNRNAQLQRITWLSLVPRPSVRKEKGVPRLLRVWEQGSKQQFWPAQTWRNAPGPVWTVTTCDLNLPIESKMSCDSSDSISGFESHDLL